jgi:His/Glu/Gln/Arg/opine family amino acid ABC transporter permease subunit
MRRTRSGLALLVALLVALPVALVGLVAGPAQAADDPGSGRVVRVGTEGTYPPFTYKDPKSGQLTGYDVEVAREVAKRAGWRLQFAPSQFDAIFAALDSKRIDMVANEITINPERQAKYLFSEPYSYSHGVIVTAADNDDIKTLDDLEGKTAAESPTSNWSQVAKKAGAEIQAVDQFAQAATLLAQGRVDVVVNDSIAVLDYLASSGSKKVKIAGDAGSDIGKQALTFRKDSPQLQQEADKALASMRKDGTLKKLSVKYFKADVSVEDGGEVTVKGRDKAGSWELVRENAWPMLRAALVVTIPLTVISFVIGLALAVLLALARMSNRPLLRGPARAYISIIRGTPLLVQLFIVFFGLPEIGIKLPSFVAAVLALSLNVAGYAAEVVRGSILSVPRGQFEAAETVGMDYGQSMRRIVLPQAARIAVPPLSNTLLSLVKDTSLVSVVALTDLFRVATVSASADFRYLALYALAAAYYWVICTLLSAGQNRLETRLERYAV